MNSHQQYIHLFNEARTLIEAGSAEPMNGCREAAFEALSALGLPSARAERYRYFDVQTAFKPDLGYNARRLMPAADPYKTYRCGVPNMATHLFFVVGDVVMPASTTPLPEGVKVMSLVEAANECPEFLHNYYNKTAPSTTDGIVALNTMLAQDGLLVYVPDGVKLEQPIQVVFVSTATMPTLHVRRLLVVMGQDAEATLLRCEHTSGHTADLATLVSEVFLEKQSRLEVYAIEETAAEHTGFVHVTAQLQDEAHLHHTTISLAAGQMRTTIDVDLKGRGASVVTDAAVVGSEHQTTDHNVVVNHIAPECRSDMLYKYVLDGASVGAFAGKVFVGPEGMKTESEQTNANLCCSPHARAYAQPMLEIYADDVKCSHGSSTGKLDDTALFYMRQRGIPEDEARLLLQHAFVGEVLQRVTLDSLRERLSHLVEMRFRGAMKKCNDCALCK